MEKQVTLRLDTLRKLQSVKNTLEGIEIRKLYKPKLMRKLIDRLDDIAEDLQIDLPSAFDLGNEENYKAVYNDD